MTTPEKWHRFRELPSDIRQRLPRLKSLLVEEGALLAYVFGSLVQTERPPQDVDLALLMPEDNPPYRLRSHINERLGTQRLDLVDLRRASPVLRFEVISSGYCLYAAGEDLQFEFEMNTIRVYQDTHYWRGQQEALLKERMQAWS